MKNEETEAATTIDCPACDGSGLVESLDDGRGGVGFEDCPTCLRTGKVEKNPEEEPAEEEEHHKYSPSSAYRLIQCSGSERMQRGIVDESSDAAKEGTDLHAIVEGRIPPEGLTAEQEVLVDKCSEYAEAVVPFGSTVYSEQKVDIWDFRTFEVITNGTADLVAVEKNGRRAILIDWKFGRVPVAAPIDNFQLALYAVGVAQKFGVEEVESHIFQPRVFGHNPPYTFRNFDAIVDRYARAIRAAESPTLSLTAGYACDYCRALPFCPAVRELNDVIDVTAKTIDPEEAEELYDRSKLLDKWSKAVQKEVKRMVEADEVESLYMIEKAGNREIVDGEGAFQAVSANLTREEFDAIVSVTIPVGKLEEATVAALRKKHPDFKVKDLRNTVRDLLASVIGRKESTFTIGKKP